MTEFMLIFVKILGVALYLSVAVGIFIGSAFCENFKDAVKCWIISLVMVVLAFTIERYGLIHWWKP